MFTGIQRRQAGTLDTDQRFQNEKAATANPRGMSSGGFKRAKAYFPSVKK